MSESKILCGVCDDLLQKDIFWDHISADHLNYRPFSCSTCHTKFVNGSELALHETDFGGHVGDYNPKKEPLKEEIIRRIFSLSVKSSRESNQKLETEIVPENDSEALNNANGSNETTNLQSVQAGSNANLNQQFDTNVSCDGLQNENAQAIAEHGQNSSSAAETQNAREATELIGGNSNSPTLIFSAASDAASPFNIDLIKLIQDELVRRREVQHGTTQMTVTVNVDHNRVFIENSSQIQVDDTRDRQNENLAQAATENDPITTIVHSDDVSSEFSASTNREATDEASKRQCLSTITENAVEEHDNLFSERNEDSNRKSANANKKVKTQQKLNNVQKRVLAHKKCLKCERLIAANQPSMIQHINSWHMKLPMHTCPHCNKVFYSMSKKDAGRHMSKCISTDGRKKDGIAQLEPISHRAANYSVLRNSIPEYFGQDEHLGVHKNKAQIGNAGGHKSIAHLHARNKEKSLHLKINESRLKYVRESEVLAKKKAKSSKANVKTSKNDKGRKLMVENGQKHVTQESIHHRKCRECGLLVDTRKRQSLLTHINFCHTKLPIYTCPICAKDFYNMMSSSARRHMRGCISKTENSHHRSKAKLELISHRATNYPLLKNSVKKYFDGRAPEVARAKEVAKVARASSTCKECKMVVQHRGNVLVCELNHINFRHIHLKVLECRICGQKIESLLDAGVKVHLLRAHGLDSKEIEADLETCGHLISRRRECAKTLKKLRHVYFD